jgi:hypothetical protein
VTFNADDIHTVTFLTDGQVRPPFPVGCPGFSAPGASFDGSTCVTSPPFVTGQTFSVLFPTAGNFKLVCLVHEDMTGTIHVLDTHLLAEDPIVARFPTGRHFCWPDRRTMFARSQTSRSKIGLMFTYVQVSNSMIRYCFFPFSSSSDSSRWHPIFRCKQSKRNDV